MAKLAKIQRYPNFSHALRQLADEVDRAGTNKMKKGQLLTGRSILRIIQMHVATREDHGQVYTYEDLMASQIKGEGKEADKDLYHFYDEWVR
eukprot:5052706-Pyramimonas_sp.AAC.1